MSEKAKPNKRQLIRQQSRAKRNALTDLEQQQASKQALQQCLNQHLLSPGSKVAFYLAADGELDPAPLFEHCWQNGITTYLPILHPFSSGHLLFLHYHANSSMQANRFGIAEPKLSCLDICPLPELNIIFTPLVAFDEKLNRMGMGGGFYDRTLAPIERDHLNTKVVGLAHECQQVESLPVDSWDVPMQTIITPLKTFTTSPPSK